MARSHDQQESDLEVRSELTRIAEGLLDGSVGLLDGCCLIAHLRHRLAGPDDEVFYPFISVADDALNYPPARARHLYVPEYLETLDQEQRTYEAEMKVSIDKAARDLIERFVDRD
jgi:hypothetical protein